MANLRSMFGMKLVCVESLIFHYLPKKVQHAMAVRSTSELAELVRRDPSHVQLSWILRLVRNAIQCEPGAAYLVDLIPNLRWLIRSQHFTQSCAEEMAAFEEKVSRRLVVMVITS